MLYANTSLKVFGEGSCFATRTAKSSVLSLPPFGTEQWEWVNRTLQLSALLPVSRWSEGIYRGYAEVEAARPQYREGVGWAKVKVFSLGQECQYREEAAGHGSDLAPCSRRMASTASMRCPIHRMTGTAIELPRAL